MSSPEKQSKKDLYKLNSNYLKDLNSIRKQLNLVEISDENLSVDDDGVSIPSSLDSSPNQELYECDNNYLTELNLVRKQLNLKPLPPDEKLSKEEIEVVEIPKIQASSVQHRTKKHRDKKKNKGYKDNTKNKPIQGAYVPPKKKICIREEETSIKYLNVNYRESFGNTSDNLTSNKSRINTTSEESDEEDIYKNQNKNKKSTSKSKFTKCSLDGRNDETNSSSQNPSAKSSPVKCLRPSINVIFGEDAYRSLNVPDGSDHEEKPRITETISKQVDTTKKKKKSSKKESELCDLPINSNIWLTSSLDIPRKSREKLEFPAIAHLPKLKQDEPGSEEVTPTKLFLKGALKKKSRIEPSNTTKILCYPVHVEKKTAPVEVHTDVSYNDMDYWRRKQSLNVNFYNVESSTSTARQSDSESEESNKAHGCTNCFKICFSNRKQKNYFR